MSVRFEYIDQIIEACEQAKNAKPLTVFEMTNIAELKGIQKAIYIISEKDGDPEKTFSNLKTFKEKNIRKCPKLNAPNDILYVGSSNSGLFQRIKQHIGDGSKATYALHLKHWFEGNYSIKIMQYGLSREALQILEDSLSYELQPAFGKRGSNSV